MSEALRLADELDALMDEESLVGAVTIDRAASELRQLHAENERLRQINQSHEMKLSVRGYEIQIDDIKALNAELVEALRKAVKLNSFREFNDHIPAMKAALTKVETSK